ncbi:hypothetical protein ACRAWB_14505 [Leifsonia poae]|uniref:hypothetical protein n=1 Tax=Leifsonia poae TaxID=110933 RepID=UPI003D685845
MDGTTGNYIGAVPLNPGSPFNHYGVYNFSEQVKSVTYTVTGTGTGFALDDTQFSSYPLNWVNNTASVTVGSGNKYTFTKISPTSLRVTIDWVNPVMNKVNLFTLNSTNTSPTAQGTFTWKLESVTPVSTGVAVSAASAPTVTKVVTWGNFVDTPVIAPLIAGIALLGAAGAGGGIALSRRAKAKANA